MVRSWWYQRFYPPGPRRRATYDWIVAYLVPTWLWRRWMRWYWKGVNS